MGINFRESSPLYRQIMEDIKSKITSGNIGLNEQIGSHQELAKFYSVSIITVKKALTELINEGVLYSRVGKGTFVARKPNSSKISSYFSIGLVLRDLKSPFFSQIVESVEKKASDSNCTLLVSSSSNIQEKEDSQIRHFLEFGVNGLIIASMTNVCHPSEMIRKLQNDNFPYVMVSYMEDEDINFVGTDHEHGAYIATEHLISLGYKKIGYISGEEGNPLGDLRESGFIRALNENGTNYNKDFVFRIGLRGGWYDYESGYEFGRLFTRLKDKPEALFIYKDLVALGFQRAVLDQGIKVPEDVAIVGFDNIKRAKIAPVPLTTVHQPIDQIGYNAVEMILNIRDNKIKENRIILKPTLVLRESCGAKIRNYSPEGKDVLFDYKLT